LKNDVTRDIIEKTIRQCRSSGVGLCQVAHYFGDVPEAISMHTDYDFIFNTKDTGLINHFRRLKGLTLDQAKEIPNLNKFECYAFGDFKLYDTDGQEVPYNGKPVKITKVKPPNCMN
jgi:hypothetical protein